MRYLGPTNPIYCEYFNEPWNTGGNQYHGTFWDATVGLFSKYYPSSSTFLTYAKGQQNTTGITTANALMSADAQVVAKAAWIANGRSADQFHWVYGSQWSNPGITSGIKSTLSTFSIPTTNTHIAIAPYIGVTEGQAAIATVMASAGDVTVTNPGNWPASALIGNRQI